MEQKLIDRINELAKKKKTEGLTPAEQEEQAALRAQYLKEFRANMEETLQAVRVEQEDGTVKTETRFANAYYDEKGNRIVVNPEARISQEKALFHELDHALRSFFGGGTPAIYKGALDSLDDTTKAKLKEQYGSNEAIFNDEANAFYAAEVMGEKGFARSIATTKPKAFEKIMNFFKDAINYKNDGYSKAARKYYKQYKEMYEAFSAVNKGNNALEGAEGGKRYSLDIDSIDISQYNANETNKIGNEQEVANEKRAVGNGYSQGRNEKKSARASSQRLQKHLNGNANNSKEGGLDRGGNSSELLYTKDSEDRRIEPQIARRLIKTKIVDRNGRPISLWHSTNVYFDAFNEGDIGFHFGTMEQAIQRAKDNEREKRTPYKVFVNAYLNIKNPIYSSRDTGNWKANATALNLWSEGYISLEERSEIEILYSTNFGEDLK